MIYNRHGDVSGFFIFISVAMIIISCIVGLMWVIPTYNVWASQLAGQARLAEAQSSREIAVREAQAKKDAAVMLAEAEVSRDRGVAEANRIIGESLTNNEAYLRYLFVNNLENTKNQVIYVPTEANLPILEANRFPNRLNKPME